MKLIELVNSVEELNKLSETKLPARAAFALGKFLKEATNDLETFNKVKIEKIKEYGTPILDENGVPTETFSFSIPGTKDLSENGKKYVDEMTEIENREITLTIPEIKIKDLGDTIIEPKDLIKLNWLIKE